MPPNPVPNARTVGSDALDSRALSDLADATAVADVGTVYVTALGGAIDPWMLIALHRRITDALDAGDDRVVLDLSAITVLGGVTVGVLCGVLRRLALGGGSGLLPDLLPEGTASADPLFPDGRTGSCLPPVIEGDAASATRASV